MIDHLIKGKTDGWRSYSILAPIARERDLAIRIGQFMARDIGACVEELGYEVTTYL